MKHTQNFISIFIMINIAVFVISCENPTSGSSGGDDAGGDGSLGESFTLPAGPIDYLPGDAEIALAFLMVPGTSSPVHFYTPANVSNGNFPGMTITAPPTEHLVDLNLFFEDGLGDISFLSISDSNAKLQILFDLSILNDTELAEENVVGFIERTDDDEFFVFWFYVDRDVQITGSTDNFTVNLNLKKGWNIVIDSWNDETKTTTLITGQEPPNVGWYYFEDYDD